MPYRFERFLGITVLCLGILFVPSASAQGFETSPADGKAVREVSNCPPINVPARETAKNLPEIGTTVAAGQLDEPLVWEKCDMPIVPEGTRGVVRLSILVDTDGNVIQVEPRGPIVHPKLHAILTDAILKWRTNRPWMRGVPVKAAFALDIRSGK